MAIKDTFGDRLCYVRENRGLTQSELAAKAGFQQAAIGHFEKNRREPSFESLKRLTEALSVSADYLLGRSDLFVGLTPSCFNGEQDLSFRERDFVQMMIDNLLNVRVPQAQEGGE